MKPKMFTLIAALFLGAAALTAPSASAQVAFRGTFPLPHGVISVGTGDPYYYGDGYSYYSPDYYVAPGYTGYYYSGYPSYYPRYSYVRPYYGHRYYRPHYRTYSRTYSRHGDYHRGYGRHYRGR